MGFARDVTPDEAALGFTVAHHLALGTIVFAKVGNGLRAIKMVSEEGDVRYEVCDEAGIVIYGRHLALRSSATIRAGWRSEDRLRFASPCGFIRWRNLLAWP